MEVETIKTVDYGYVWLYGCRSKAMSADLAAAYAERWPCL